MRQCHGDGGHGGAAKSADRVQRNPRKTKKNTFQKKKKGPDAFLLLGTAGVGQLSRGSPVRPPAAGPLPSSSWPSLSFFLCFAARPRAPHSRRAPLPPDDVISSLRGSDLDPFAA